MLFFSQTVCEGAINTRSSSRFPGHLGCCTRSHQRLTRGTFTRCRFVYAEQRGRPGCEGLQGLDKARLRHRRGRPAMDTTESAESAHSPARPPSRSRCPPPAQPGYLSAGIYPRAFSTLAPCPPPKEPEDRLAPARPHSPSTSALALYPPPLPLPVPGALAKSELSPVARFTFFVRGLRLPSCRSEGFWRPWVRTPGEKEERTEPRAAEAVSDSVARCGSGCRASPLPTPNPGLGSKGPSGLCPQSAQSLTVCLPQTLWV